VHRLLVLLLAVGVVLAGLTVAQAPVAEAAAPKATAVRGFALPDQLQPGQVVRDRFRVTGPKRRPVVIQHRAPGQRWQTVQRARTTGTRQVLVRATVVRSGDGWVWKAWLQDKRWTTIARTTETVHEFRVRVPARGRWDAAGSRTESVSVDTRPPPAPGTSIRPSRSQQVLVADRTSGVRGTYRRFEWRPAEERWARVGSSQAVFGYGGVVAGSRRVQDTGTTPAGTYRLLYAFGAGDPGTAMRYRPVTDCSHWVLDRDAADYNRWRESCTRRPRDGEHLQTYVQRGLYRHAVVTSFNYDDPRVRSGAGSGGAIFLHYATQYTGGCVGLTSMAELTRTVRWLDPDKRPLIVIKR
jgi:L,D-peptidoglycan transpeptidase YkuD (ErfK/YbiS/YcfS/YnhG family)